MESDEQGISPTSQGAEQQSSPLAASAETSRRPTASIKPNHAANVTLPGWKAKLIAEQIAAESASMALVHAECAREKAASERLLRLRARTQREQNRTASIEARLRQYKTKQNGRLAVQAETDRLVGRDVTSSLAELPTPGEAEIRELSALFNRQLAAKFRPEERSFFKLFKRLEYTRA